MIAQVFIPKDTTAVALGADSLALKMAQNIESRSLDAEVHRNGSRGMFWLEPMVEVKTESSRIAFGPVNASDIESVLDAIDDHLAGKSIDHPLYLGEVEKIDYLAKQQS